MAFPYSLVIFDLDGTLVDSAADIAESVNRTLSDWRLPVYDVKQITGWIGEGSRQLITYAFRDETTGAITYIGRASGPGSPSRVLSRRLGAGHDHFRPGLKPEVIGTHTSRMAGQGAEEFFVQGFRQEGRGLTNIDPPLSLRPHLRGKSIQKLEAFFNELAGL